MVHETLLILLAEFCGTYGKQKRTIEINSEPGIAYLMEIVSNKAPICPLGS
jgi:hypothetical protein